MESLFENWKPRASQIGYLMTNLPEKFTEENKKELNLLLEIKQTGINPDTGRANKWSDTLQSKLEKLKKLKKGVDELPTGAVTKLEEIFNHIFWLRKKLLNNKYLEKGIMVEEDALQLLSEVDGVIYWKNDIFLETEYSQGTPDNMFNRIRDTKSNYEFDTFQKAELNSLYSWQIKDYTLMAIELGHKIERTGELCYCLVNSPWHRIEAERKSLFYSMGMPEEHEERWIKAASQLERNHIFDIHKFKEDYPNVDLINTFWRDIPKHMRVKKFEVTLEDEDIKHIKRRSKMAKEWLLQREQKEIELINR
jgi:hypothetical protein